MEQEVKHSLDFVNYTRAKSALLELTKLQRTMEISQMLCLEQHVAEYQMVMNTKAIINQMLTVSGGE